MVLPARSAPSGAPGDQSMGGVQEGVGCKQAVPLLRARDTAPGKRRDLGWSSGVAQTRGKEENWREDEGPWPAGDTRKEHRGHYHLRTGRRDMAASQTR